MPASPNPQLLALIGFTSAIKPGVKPNLTQHLNSQPGLTRPSEPAAPTSAPSKMDDM